MLPPVGVGRSALAVATCVALSGTLTGCSPTFSGTVGVTKTRDGQIEFVIATCQKPVDWLKFSGSSAGSSPNYAQARWDADPVVEAGTVTTVPADGSRAPWQLTTPPLTLDRDWTYNVQAGSDGDLLNAAVRTAWGVQVTVPDLDRLKPGYVLVPGDAAPVSLDEFETNACQGESGP